MNYSYKEGTFEFWIKIKKNPNWLKNELPYKFFDAPLGDARIKILKTPDMKFYVENYHPLTYIRTLSYDLRHLDKEKDYYIVLTWTEIEIVLYINGKPVGRVKNEMEVLVK
ncbi:MAG: hypothetical protein AB1630_04370 [bacterium]